MQKVICGTWPTSQINIKAKYPWCQGIWWDGKGMLYCKRLKQGKTNNAERYRQQLIKLKWAIAEKRPIFATRHKVTIFHHDNANVARLIKNYWQSSGWQI